LLLLLLLLLLLFHCRPCCHCFRFLLSCRCYHCARLSPDDSLHVIDIVLSVVFALMVSRNSCFGFSFVTKTQSFSAPPRHVKSKNSILLSPINRAKIRIGNSSANENTASGIESHEESSVYKIIPLGRFRVFFLCVLCDWFFC